MDELLTPREVAARLKIQRKTLLGWRRNGGGPPSIKIGKRVRYPKIVFEKWFAKRIKKASDRIPV